MGRVSLDLVRGVAKAADLEFRGGTSLWYADRQVLRLDMIDGESVDEESYDSVMAWIQDNILDEVHFISRYLEIIRPDDFGLLGLAFKTAPTIGASLAVLQQYYCLYADNPSLKWRRAGRSAFLVSETTSPTPKRYAAAQFKHRCTFAAIVRAIRLSTAENVPIRAVHLKCPPPNLHHRYESLLGCPVIYGAGIDALEIEVAALVIPNCLGDDAVFEHISGELARKVREVCGRSAIVAKVSAFLRDRLPGSKPQLAEVAQELGLSERTLARRLAEQGTSFRQILQMTQADLAVELLNSSPLTLAQVAIETGFTEQSTFSRAFKRWVGRAPSEYRQEISANSATKNSIQQLEGLK